MVLPGYPPPSHTGRSVHSCYCASKTNQIIISVCMSKWCLPYHRPYKVFHLSHWCYDIFHLKEPMMSFISQTMLFSYYKVIWRFSQLPSHRSHDCFHLTNHMADHMISCRPHVFHLSDQVFDFADFFHMASFISQITSFLSQITGYLLDHITYHNLHIIFTVTQL